MIHSASTSSDSLPEIPGYRIVELLYLGSRTAVYRAVQAAQQRPVVIKVLRCDYPSFGELVQFRNQYTIAKNLHIPGTICPYSLEAYGSSYALVMEDVGGVSLKDYIQKNSLSLAEILAIALQLAEILHHLCHHRLVHKDIKPANILIHPQSKQVKLIDFSIASLLPKETQEIQSPNILEGTLAYLAPEQTGRMNRGIDYRADFYALGVTLYQLLTGQLPFVSDDALELVHCHIAKVPVLVDQVNAEVPAIVAAIVAKLMAKNAEDRYQSALGLKHDLEQCLQAWQATGAIATFELGQRDLSDRFTIPEKLYGRETEVQTLLAAFDRVASGNSEMMLVAGFSGVGKTAVVNEVHKPITRQQGYFIKGKYDQFNRNIPLSAFVQAWRDLIAQLLSESDAQLRQWRTQILAAVGENGQVLIEVIPELEQIIGQQPIAPELSGSAAQNRFSLLFQKFIEVFTTPEHPLVVFLDDLQWADSTSLQLINLLMQDQGHLLLLGAYRDNEVSAAHPFMMMVEELKKTTAIVNTITLSALASDDINCLIADTLNCAIERSQPLTELIIRKTQGNPFFTTQFLKALYADGYITFNREQRYWECDIAEINALSLTDDVLEFMALQLQKLPLKTQQVLKLATCIGNQFDLATLAIVSEQSPIDTATALWKALQEGLILPTSQIYKFFQSEDTEQLEIQNTVNPAYRFLHDRVQQAAYTLIAETEKQITHFKIGQLLLNNLSKVEREEHILEIVNQLNYGIQLITRLEQQIELAQLNLAAGQKAKAATAYAAAAKYFDTGLQLLPPNSWSEAYELTLALFLEAMDAEMLTANTARSEALAEIILKQAVSPLDVVKVYETKIQIYVNNLQQSKAVEVGFQALEQLGLSLPTMLDLAHELPALPALEQVDKLPEMTDPHYLAQLRLLIAITSPVLNSKPELIFAVVSAQVYLCIQYGHSGLAAFSYSWYGTLLCGNPETIEAGYLAGQIAKELLERFNETTLKSAVYNMFYLFIKPWKTPMRDAFPHLLEGMQAGLEVGDLVYASYCGSNYCVYQFFVGERLEEVERELTRMIESVQKLKNEFMASCLSIWKQLDLNLQGMAIDCYQLVGDSFDEKTALPQLQAANVGWSLFNVYLAKATLLYTFNDYEGAIANTILAFQYASAVGSWIPIANNNLYHSLALLAHYSQIDSSQQSQYLIQIEANQAQLRQWAFHAPCNFQHKYDLVKAEQSRVLGNRAEAIESYDHAIAGAKSNRYLQEEALANELAAKFYLDWNKEKIAAGYMQEAYYGYARWGAKAKVQDLECRYPQLLAPILQQQRLALLATETISAPELLTSQAPGTRSSISSSTSISTTLDLASVLKASQALSSEMQLDKLLATLLQTVLENAGADKGALLLPQEQDWLVRAVATLDQPVQVQAIAFSDNTDLPHSLIHKVKRDLQPIVLVDAVAHPTWATDAYIEQQQPKSVLCMPILHQGKLVAILYLENRVAVSAFTRDRVELLNVLCTQAAISLENARLYAHMQDNQRQLATLLSNLPGMAYSCANDKDWTMRFVSQGCFSLTGYHPEEILGNHSISYAALIHPEDVDLVDQAVQTAVAERRAFQMSYRIQTRQGEEKWVWEQGQGFFDREDHLLSLEGFITDVSDRKAAETIILQKSQVLEQALQDLQNAQLQIVQNEKMASLGNLVAGVAHEINNPIGFLNGSIKNAQDYVQDLLDYVALYQQHHPNPSASVQNKAQEIDLEFLSKDLPNLLNSMNGATDRIKSISTGLRIFSRADREHKVSAALHDGIESTLLILKYRLKANEHRPAIQVIRDYGELPQVECFPGQLNQVFMNVLANAIDVFDEMAHAQSFIQLEAKQQQITIRTVADSSQVQIYICDNGKGMNQAVQAKIFDHSFTTKTVGKGTGLGLAIARQIVVENHGGSLEVCSQIEQGTEFLIRLPISH